jgi:hypothetical protein
MTMSYKQYMAIRIYDNFVNVDKLGFVTNTHTGTYSHSLATNKIGCAIGCLLPPLLAEKLEDITERYDQYLIYDILTFLSPTTPEDILVLYEIKQILEYDGNDQLLELDSL